MDKARQVRVVYRDSYLTTLRRLLRNKFVIVSMILMLAGVIMFANSLQHNDVIKSKFAQEQVMQVTPNSNTTFYFNEPGYIPSNVSFSIPGANTVFYNIHGVDNYTRGSQEYTYTFGVTSGTASNNSVVKISKTYNPQGQEYILMIHSTNGQSFKVHVSVVAWIFLIEHSDSKIGGPGIIMAVTGAIVLSASVSRIYRSMRSTL